MTGLLIERNRMAARCGVTSLNCGCLLILACTRHGHCTSGTIQKKSAGSIDPVSVLKWGECGWMYYRSYGPTVLLTGLGTTCYRYLLNWYPLFAYVVRRSRSVTDCTLCMFLLLFNRQWWKRKWANNGSTQDDFLHVAQYTYLYKF